MELEMRKNYFEFNLSKTDKEMERMRGKEKETNWETKVEKERKKNFSSNFLNCQKPKSRFFQVQVQFACEQYGADSMKLDKLQLQAVQYDNRWKLQVTCGFNPVYCKNKHIFRSLVIREM